MINLADLPAVRAQLARDAENLPKKTNQVVEADATASAEAQSKVAGYPSKKLTLQPGGYYTVTSEKSPS